MFAGKLLDAGVKAKKEERPMQLDELLPLPKVECCDYSTEALEENWNQIIAEGKEPSMGRAACRTYKKHIFLATLLRLLHDGAYVGAPFAFREVVIWYQTPTAPLWQGIVWCIILAFLNSLALLLMLYSNEITMEALQSLRGAVHVMIFQKSLRLKSIQGVQGKIIALHGSDIARLKEMGFLSGLATAPFALVAYLVAIYLFVGYAVFFVIAVLLITMPIQGLMSRSLGTHISSMSSAADHRLKLISEIVQGIRICKFMNWEQSFEDHVEEVRAEEVRSLKKVIALRNIIIGTSQLVPLFLQLVVFGAGYGIGQDISAENVFPTLALLMSFRGTVMSINLGLSKVVDLKEILVRCTALLSLEEKQPYVTVRSPPPGHTTTDNNSYPVCSVKQMTFGAFVESAAAARASVSPRSGDGDDGVANNEPIAPSTRKPTPPPVSPSATSPASSGEAFKPLLVNVNLAFPKGSLTIVTGPTGCGKSILIQALAGEGTPDPQSLSEGGVVEQCGGVAYVTQEAWILNATFRKNITLDSGIEGGAVDQSRYEEALRCCCLKPDIALLPAGEETEIGERGINLSGGQKQRVALARALYSSRELILLDDPLSAVDPHVCASLFHDCIAGAMNGRTRVLVTHHVQFLPFADQVVIIRNGAVDFVGTYEAYQERTRGMKSAALGPSPLDSASAQSPKEERKDEKGQDESNNTDVVLPGSTVPPGKEKGKLVVEEEQRYRTIGTDVYLWYLGLTSYRHTVNCLVGFVVWRLGQMFCDVWLQLWSTKSPGFGQDQPFTQNEYLLWFCISGVGAIFGTVWRQWGFTSLMVSISAHSHRPLLRSLLRAPVAFFDITPAGRILNRFSKDMQTLDMLLPEYANFILSIGINLIGVVLLILVVSVYLVPVLLLCAVAFYWLGTHFAATSRATKRIENVERSPMMAIMSEVLSGLETVRAYGLQGQFLRSHNKRTDSMFRALYSLRQGMVWVGTRNCLIGFGFALSLSAFAVLYKEVDTLAEATFDKQFVILSMALVNQLSPWMGFMLFIGVQTDEQMSSAERAKEYCEELPQEIFIDYEGEERTTTTSKVATHVVYPRPPESWPFSGSVRFSNVSVRYRDGPLVLRDLSLDIPSGAKVGVVGRTGSGKSTLMLALFRILELAEGQVEIDGHDIAHVKLEELRRQINIIPQDPTLFEGSVRSNLDPFFQHSDKEVWQALKEVGLEERIDSEVDENGEGKGLNCEVLPKGANFSVGQRQLMCLARALLKKDAKVLFLDEATASVDFEADAIMQETIRTAFAHHTVITIAHRLATVIESDLIAVLDGGQLIEYGTPAELLSKENTDEDEGNGLFARMVANLGPEQAKELKGIAAKIPQQ